MNKKNSGFSLVEVMIVAAALGGLAMVGMQLTQTQSKASVKSSFESETNLITNEIVAILSDPNKCLNTLGGKNALSTNAGINSINGNKYFSVASGSSPASGYGNGGVKITSYAISASATDVANQNSFLIINYQNKKILKGSNGAANISKKVNLYVEVNGANNITRCRSLSSSSADIWSRGSGADIYYSAGNVGIGTTIPKVALDVAGGVLVGDQTQATVCNSAVEGTQRYNKTTHAMEFCGASGSPLVYSWQPMGGGGGGPAVYTAWGTTCKAGDNTLYTGSTYASALNGVGSGASDFICSTGATRSHYRVNDAFTSYQWDPPFLCSTCATPPGKTCYENWGSQSCPASYSAAYTGYMFQGAWSNTGTSGKIICRAGARVGGIYVANTNTSAVTSYGWLPGDACAVCCSN